VPRLRMSSVHRSPLRRGRPTGRRNPPTREGLTRRLGLCGKWNCEFHSPLGAFRLVGAPFAVSRSFGFSNAHWRMIERV
jgi:hypothetical protein